MDLEMLAAFYGTDKFTHGYMPFYEQTLPKTVNKILEIGCHKGASLKMWRAKYPEARIDTLDLFQEFPIPNDIPSLYAWKADQTNVEILTVMRRNKYDVIIDDGSHNSRDQLITFFALACPGTYYYIEDLHCQDEEYYSQELPMDMNAGHIFKNHPKAKYHTTPKGAKIVLIKC